jgi:hypothetical protein
MRKETVGLRHHITEARSPDGQCFSVREKGIYGFAIEMFYSEGIAKSLFKQEVLVFQGKNRPPARFNTFTYLQPEMTPETSDYRLNCSKEKDRAIVNPAP